MKSLHIKNTQIGFNQNSTMQASNLEGENLMLKE